MRSAGRDRIVFAHSTTTFDDERGNAPMRIVFDPLRHQEQSEADDRDADSPQTLDLRIHLPWRPDDLTARPSGTLRLEQLGNNR